MSTQLGQISTRKTRTAYLELFQTFAKTKKSSGYYITRWSNGNSPKSKLKPETKGSGQGQRCRNNKAGQVKRTNDEESDESAPKRTRLKYFNPKPAR